MAGRGRADHPRAVRRPGEPRVPERAGRAATLRTLPQVQGPVVRVAAVARVPPAVRTVAPVALPTVALRVTVPVARQVARRVVRLLPQATVSPLGSVRLAAVLVARAAARAGHRPVALVVLGVPALEVRVGLVGQVADSGRAVAAVTGGAAGWVVAATGGQVGVG